MQSAPTSLLKTLEPLSPGGVSKHVPCASWNPVSQGLSPFRMNVGKAEQLDMNVYSYWISRVDEISVCVLAVVE